MLGERVRLVLRIEPDLPRVRVDPGQFHQIAVNLAVNARDAMPDGGTLGITLSSGECPAEAEVDSPQAEAGRRRWVVLRVADDGMGMEEFVRARAFEPFFTTKPAGRGTGLGLSTVYGIVKQNGGHVEMSSEPDSGTIVRVYLPQAAPAESAPDTAPGDSTAEDPTPEQPDT